MLTTEQIARGLESYVAQIRTAFRADGMPAEVLVVVLPNGIRGLAAVQWQASLTREQVAVLVEQLQETWALERLVVAPRPKEGA